MRGECGHVRYFVVTIKVDDKIIQHSDKAIKMMLLHAVSDNDDDEMLQLNVKRECGWIREDPLHK